MARTKDKEKAIKLRKSGMSYSQIKDKLGISKSTLSGWLRDMPLTKDRMDELQRNEKVIEKIRATKLKKREQRLESVYKKVCGDLGAISNREFLIAGLFLYWAEGGKTQKYSISLSNTDPSMIRAYIKWLILLHVPKDKIKAKLHLYADMDEEKEVRYWLRQSGLARSHFLKSYIKKSNLSDLTHITRGHGNCNIIVNGRDISEYVLQGLRHVSSLY